MGAAPQLSREQADRFQRAIDLVGLAVGRDNDCAAASRAVAAVRLEDAQGLIGPLVSIAADLVDCVAANTGADPHDIMLRIRR